MPRSHLAFAGLAIGGLLFATGCATTIPASDPTPPDVRLTVIGAGPTFTMTPTSPDESRTVAVPDEVTLLASAKDEQGVKDVWISGSMRVSCQSGDIGQATFVEYLANNPEDPSVGVGDEGVDQRVTFLKLDSQRLAGYCRDGFNFLGASGSFRATGQNFHGGMTSTAVFTLQVNP